MTLGSDTYMCYQVFARDISHLNELLAVAKQYDICVSIDYPQLSFEADHMTYWFSVALKEHEATITPPYVYGTIEHL